MSYYTVNYDIVERKSCRATVEADSIEEAKEKALAGEFEPYAEDVIEYVSNHDSDETFWTKPFELIGMYVESEDGEVL